MKQAEILVAQIPQSGSMDEEQLNREITDIEFQAEALTIESDDDYAFAGEFGKLLKQKAAQVTTFFKPMKDSAYQAHKAICDREKTMLTPLRNAEKTVKRTMGDYLMEQERKRKAEEEAARKAAAAERERKLSEATELESAGDVAGAEAAMAEAMVMDDAAAYSVSASANPKVSGVSTSKDWEITEINPNMVPVALAGVEIRPVDQAAVMRLIRASKGTIEIPGISYKQVAKMSFRR